MILDAISILDLASFYLTPMSLFNETIASSFKSKRII